MISPVLVAVDLINPSPSMLADGTKNSVPKVRVILNMLMLVSVFHHFGLSQLLLTGKGGGAICGWEFDTLAHSCTDSSHHVSTCIWDVLVSFLHSGRKWRRVGHLYSDH